MAKTIQTNDGYQVSVNQGEYNTYTYVMEYCDHTGYRLVVEGATASHCAVGSTIPRDISYLGMQKTVGKYTKQGRDNMMREKQGLPPKWNPPKKKKKKPQKKQQKKQLTTSEAPKDNGEG